MSIHVRMNFKVSVGPVILHISPENTFQDCDQDINQQTEIWFTHKVQSSSCQLRFSLEISSIHNTVSASIMFFGRFGFFHCFPLPIFGFPSIPSILLHCGDEVPMQGFKRDKSLFANNPGRISHQS